jgi:pyruvate, orthophosphate dikinase
MSLVFDLDRDHRLPPDELRKLVGAKAANLAVMASELRLPVPPGFVISTQACREYLAGGWPAGLDAELRAHIERMQQRTGRQFGGQADPMLVSVRSGAPVSMPGMMDTILNLGLNVETSAALSRASGNVAFARDCEQRFASMFGAVVGRKPPADVWDQLRAAIEAVFRSWNTERARAYRQIEGIPDDLGTAVAVQAMVFGNSTLDSATGVLFTRNPVSGQRAYFGDVLFQAQGEDVVSGARQTLPVAMLEDRMPEVARQLWQYADVLERRFSDMCDIEFTIESGSLWLLQVRVGKRSSQAALRMAVQMAEDPTFPLSREQAIRRVASLLRQPSSHRVAIPGDREPITKGLPASPGLATGEIATSPMAAKAASGAGRPYILVRAETSPEDVPLMASAAGVLTSRGGVASHAAVVARGWDVPAVVSASGLEVGDGVITVGSKKFEDGATMTVDGSTGHVYDGAVAGERVSAPEADTLLAWAREAGIELTEGAGGPSSAAPGSPGHHAVALEDVIRCLAIKGMASIDMLADALLTTAAAVESVLAELADEGTVVLGNGSARLSDAGTAQAAALIEANRRQWSAQAAAGLLDAFLPFDQRVKTAVTAWQVRSVCGQQVLNDHADASYDATVLADLRTIHAEMTAWLSSIGDASGRLRAYAARLDRAAAAVAAGDYRFVSSPRVDSYHSVWFELHEELLRLAGRSRPE